MSLPCFARHRLSCLFPVLTSDLPQLPIYLTITKMCLFDDDYRDSYESRVEIRNGRQYYTQEYCPGYGMSRRRKYGFGGSYYPSRYYARAPTGRYMSSAYTHPRQYIQSGRYPRGVVPGGYSRGVVSGGYSQAMVPRNFVRGGYPEYSSGYAYGTGYHVEAQQVMPVNSAMVSSRSFLSSPIALPRHCVYHTAAALHRHHWLTRHLEHRVHLGLHCGDNVFSSA